MDHPYTPSKPRLNTNHTDRLPLTPRPGAMDASQLPSRYGNRLTWPNGQSTLVAQKEPTDESVQP